MAASAPASVASLQHVYERKTSALQSSPMDRPLLIESQDRDRHLVGDLYAVLDYPLADLQAALATPAQWCEMLTLLPTIRDCTADASGRRVVLHFARRFDQPVRDAESVAFAAHVERSSAGYLGIELTAQSGPLGTRDYRITLQAMPAGDARSFVHLHYGYRYGFAARLAAQVYLSTSGRDKVGFTTVGSDGTGQPAYVGGVRASIERNAMRLYLALDAHVAALHAPAADRRERAVRLWLDAIARYPLQLAEADPEAYFAAKRGASR